MFITTSVVDRVATITLDRPDKLNAFTGTMREDLLATLQHCGEDEEVGAVVITGAGRAFCAGGDVEYMKSLQDSGDAEGFRRLLDAGSDIVLQIARMEKPVIASINGVAAGAGCNLALACDYRIAADTAKLSQSFVKIGLHPDWGGTWLLPRLVGKSRALEILLTGRMVDAAEALQIGMIDRVVSPAELASASSALALVFASAPPVAAKRIKHALAVSEANDFATQLRVEAGHQLSCFESEEARNRIAAFVQR